MEKKVRKKRASVKKKARAPKKTAGIPFWQKLIPPAILSMITTAFYYPSLRYPFQFDDIANITKKFHIRSYDALGNWWHNRRWIGEWLNRLNFTWGRFDPYYYRLTNLIIHILAGVVIFYLILEACAHLKKRAFFAKHALSIATTTTALFLLHPVQTQTVSYVIQARLEGLAALFVCGTLLLIVKAFQAQNTILKTILIVSSLIVGFISCGTKEIAIVSPFLALIVDWFFIAEEEWLSFKSRLWFHAVFSTIIFAKCIHYVSPEFFSNAIKLKIVTGNNRGNILTQTAQDVIKPFQFFYSEFKVVLHYLWIFLFPVGLSVEYDWKLCENFFAPNSFFPFLLLATIFSLAAYSIYKKKYSFAGIGIMWFLVAIAPRSTIIPSPELICDYKTYLPSIGWLFVIATCIVATLNYLFEKIQTKQLERHFLAMYPMHHVVAIILLSLPIGYAAMQRNLVWSSSVAFWQDIVEKAPLKARGHNNLGVALSEEGKYTESIDHYLEAIRLDRQYSDPWSNLAVAYSMNGKIEKAIQALRQAIKIFPNYPEAYNNLGTLLIKKKRYDAAEKILNIAIRLRPFYGKAYFNLARLYLNKGDTEKAWQYFKKSTEGDLDTVEGFMTLGQMSINAKKFDAAVEAYNKALNLLKDPRDKRKTKILFGIANSQFMLKEFEKAEQSFEVLCRMQPNDHRYWYNMGETLFSQKKFKKALQVFGKLTQPPFNLLQANFRYASCLEKTNQLKLAQQALQRVANAKKIPENYRTMAQKEVGRLALQQKINSGNCTLTMKDFQQAFKNTTTHDQA